MFRTTIIETDKIDGTENLRTYREKRKVSSQH